MIRRITFHQLLAFMPLNLIDFMIGFGSGICPLIITLISNKVTIQQSSLTVAIYYVGRALGPFFQSYAIDRRGRKFLLIIAASLLFVQNMLQLSNKPETAYAYLIARTCLGLASGIHRSTASIYIGENCTPSLRGTLNAVLNLSKTIGMLFAYVLSAYCDYTILNVISTSISLFSLVGSVVLLREPAQFLLMKGRSQQAADNFFWFRGKTTDTEQEFDEIQIYIDREQNHTGKSLWSKVCTPEARWTLTVVTVLVFLVQQAGKSALNSFITLAFVDSRLSLSPAELTILSSVINVLMQFVGAPIIDNFSRKTMYIFWSLTLACCSLLTAALYVLERSDHSFYFTVIKFFTITLNTGILGSMLNPLSMAILGELLPQHVKGIGSALATLMGSAGGFTSSYLFLPIMRNFGIEYNFCMYAVFSSAVAIHTYFFLIETRGKTLVQIQNEIRKKCRSK